MTIFAFQLFTKLGFGLGLPNNSSYFSSETTIFTFDGVQPFNFLNMIFEFPNNDLITNPLIVLFYVWFCLAEILGFAMIIVWIIQKIKNQNMINS